MSVYVGYSTDAIEGSEEESIALGLAKGECLLPWSSTDGVVDLCWWCSGASAKNVGDIVRCEFFS